MIYITGDTHSTLDWEKINTARFPEQKDLTKDDYLIIIGDFGGILGVEGQDDYIIKAYNDRPFTTLFIDGNHENHDLLDKYPVQEWRGGKVHFISDSVIHLMRGQVYGIDGLTVFTMGGAESTDKAYRQEGVSWWSREMPSDEEYEEAIRNLEKHDFKVDIVLTHCAPEGYIGKNMRAVYNSDISRLLADNMEGVCDRSGNRLTRFFDDLITVHGLQYKHWYFGHYHRDTDWDKFSLVFNKVRKISNKDWEISCFSRSAFGSFCKEHEDYRNSAVISFCDPDRTPVDLSEVRMNRTVLLGDLDQEIPDVRGLARFICDVITSDADYFICQCEYGQCRSVSCAKAIIDFYGEHSYKDIFANLDFDTDITDCFIDEMIYTSIKDALEKEVLGNDRD
ncbi:Calcineurin-like phosphoesterase [Ruminococcaceae bacterium YRB3002]|nr:Calcineurin-like phosphoesterase [Ruminococcaceae bacterium YRB3002]